MFCSQIKWNNKRLPSYNVWRDDFQYPSTRP